MSYIISKFGGSSVSNAGQYKKIKAIIEQDKKRKFIVVSAAGKQTPDEIKITDLLYTCHKLSQQKLPFHKIFNQIEERYLLIEKELALKTQLQLKLNTFKQQLLNDNISIDFVASRGEYFSGILMSNYLNCKLIHPEKFILFNSLGQIDSQSYTLLKEALLNANSPCVIPGFYGQGSNGKIKTFSRGGSDITGAIVAKAINAKTYENWTDVSGFLMTDPRIVNQPKTISEITYRELRELAYMGANVFHDEAIAPVRDAQIPIHIKNTNAPDDQGTLILSKRSLTKQSVIGIAGKKNVCIFHIEKHMMNKERGFGRKVLGIFESNGVNYEHSPTGIDSMSVVVLKDELTDKKDLLCDSIQRIMQPDSVYFQDNLALIATVGEGMQSYIGAASQLFNALKESNINVKIIDQGSSELNIIIGIEEQDYTKAIQSLYSTFINT